MKTRSTFTATGSLILLAAGQACDAQVDAGYEGEPLLTLAGQVERQQPSPAGAEVGVLWLASDPEDECSGPQRNEIGFETGGLLPAGADRTCSEGCGSPFDLQGVAAWESCQRDCGVPDARAGSIIDYSVCGSAAIGQTTPVFGNFPAQFSLDVLRPPPARALMPSDTGERLALGYFVALSPQTDSLSLSLRDGPPPWLLGGSETHVLMYAADSIDYESSWGLYLGSSFEPGYHLLRVEHGTRCGTERFSPYHREELMPATDTEPMLASTSDNDGQPYTGSRDPPANPGQPDTGETDASRAPESPSEPDVSGIAHVCGNGVCESEESCESCSDCTGCFGPLAGASSGITNQMPGYFCYFTPSRLIADPGEEADIRLLIARPELIDWPNL
jgi:hypothetical protein